MTRFICALAALSVAGCAPPPRPTGVDPSILEQTQGAAARGGRPPAAVDQALIPPARLDMPDVAARQLDPRFDLSVSNAPAPQVFASIVSGTRYNMLVHPSVGGMVSINLKDVTVQEALEAIRDLYGYDYRIQGSRIFIQPVSIQTRVFNVNYLIGQRIGRSDLRITSGSVSDTPGTPGAPGVAGVAPVAAVLPGAQGAAGLATVTDSARVQTQTRADFWDDLERTVKILVGVEPGRSVVVNPQAGVVVVRAFPAELRSVDSYLKAIQTSVERQVVLEAKVIEVTLNGQFQTGINWAAFPNGGSIGPVSPGAVLQRKSADGSPARLGLAASDVNINSTTANSSAINSAGLVANPGASLINLNIPGASLFGLAFQTRNFAALLTFLQSQGNVQVLSSPRIATINNQKAVLKVGIDQFFVTNISGNTSSTTTTTAGGTTVPAFPTITLRPFFSGVALDITPQIDDQANIILHIHPAVSDVQTDNRVIDLGQGFGSVSLPLAKSNVSETDSVVKVGDGNIVAIGGLMKVDLEDNRSGLPGTIDTPVAGFFGSTNKTLVKKELVILIKPTVVQSDADWERGLRETRERFEGMGARSDVRQQ